MSRESGNFQKLHMLMEFSALINASLKTTQIRQRAIEAATRLLDADAGSLLLVDIESRELFFEVVSGSHSERLNEIRLGIGQGIAGWVAEHNQSVIIDDAQQDPRFFRHADLVTSYETRSVVAVPVCADDQVIGVLEAINKRNGVFSEDDRDLLTSLAHQVAPAIENARLFELLRDSFYGVSMAFAEALEKRDAYTGGHTQRVSRYCLEIGSRLGLDEKTMESLWLASILHDIGKIGVSDSVLQKNGRLDNQEFVAMCQHSEYGAEILSHIRSHRAVVPGVRSHHEKYDGSGYPDSLAGDEIPLIARIIAVADAFDAMTSDRPYRRALSQKEAMEELIRYKGIQFDSQLVDVFVAAHTGD